MLQNSKKTFGQGSPLADFGGAFYFLIEGCTLWLVLYVVKVPSASIFPNKMCLCGANLSCKQVSVLCSMVCQVSVLCSEVGVSSECVVCCGRCVK